MFLKKLLGHIITFKKIYLLFILSLSLFSIYQLRTLKSDFSYRVWFNNQDPALLSYDRYQEEFGTEDSIALAIHAPQGLWRENVLKDLIGLSEKVAQLPHIVAVDSLSETDIIRKSDQERDEVIIAPLIESPQITPGQLAQMRHHTLLHNYLYNEQEDTLYIYGRLKPFIKEAKDYEQTYQALNKLISRYPLKSQAKLYITGDGVIIPALSQAVMSDIKVIVPLLILLIFGLSYLMFRSFRLLFYELTVIILTVVTTLGLATLLGFTFNPISSLAVQVITAICLCDVLHLFSSLHQSVDHDLGPETTSEVMRHNFAPTLLTTITTSIGFYTLSFTKIKPIADFGVLICLGGFMAWIYTYLLFPYVSLGKNPKRRQKLAVSPNLILWLKKYTKPVFATTILLGTLSLMGAQTLRVNANTIDLISQGSFVRKSYDFFKENLGITSGVDIVLSKDQDTLGTMIKKISLLEKEILKIPKVKKVQSIKDYLHDFSAALNGQTPPEHQLPGEDHKIKTLFSTMDLLAHDIKTDWMTADDEKFIVSVLWSTNGSAESNAQVRKLEDLLHKLRIKGSIQGKSVLVGEINEYLVLTFGKSIMMAIILLFITMFFYLKNIRLTLLTLIPNLLPILLGLGAMALFGLDLNHSTVMVFSVCLGIAIDDTIHFILSVQKNNHLPMEQNIRQSLATKGRTLIETSIILTLSFLSFALGQVSINYHFGILVGLVITMTLFFDLIFLPMLLLATSKNENNQS